MSSDMLLILTGNCTIAIAILSLYEYYCKSIFVGSVSSLNWVDVFYFRHIYSHYQNVRGIFLEGKTDLIPKLQNFLNEQQAYMQKMAATHSSNPLWRNVGLILSQYFGLVDGYHHGAPKDMVCLRLRTLCLELPERDSVRWKTPECKFSEQLG